MALREIDHFMVDSLKRCDKVPSEKKHSKSQCSHGLDSESENKIQKLSSSELFSQDHKSKLIYATKPQDVNYISKLFLPRSNNTHSEILVSKLSSLNKLTTENHKPEVMCSVQVLSEDQNSKLSSCKLLRENYNSTFHSLKTVSLIRDLQSLSTSEHILKINDQCKSNVFNTSQVQDNNGKHKDIIMKEYCFLARDSSASANIPDVADTSNMTSPRSEKLCHLNATFDSIDLPVVAVESDQFKEDKGSHKKSPQALPSDQRKVASQNELSVDLKSNFISITSEKVKRKARHKEICGKRARHRLTGTKHEGSTDMITENDGIASQMEPQDGLKQENINTKAAIIDVKLAGNNVTDFQSLSSNGMNSQIHLRKLSSGCNFELQTRNGFQTKKRKCSLNVTYGEKIRYMYTNLLGVQHREKKASSSNNGQKEKGSAMTNRRQRQEKRSICLKAHTPRRKHKQIGTSAIVKSTYKWKENDTLGRRNRISQVSEQNLSVQKHHIRSKLKSIGRRENIAKNPSQSDKMNFVNKRPFHVSNGSSLTQTKALNSQRSAQISIEFEDIRDCDRDQADIIPKHDNISGNEFGCENISFQKKNPSLEQISKKSSVFQSIANTLCTPEALASRSHEVKARRSLWRSSVEGSKRLSNITPLGGSPKEVLDLKRDSASNKKTCPLSRKRLLQVSPMVKDKSVSDPYEFKVTPAKETTILYERSKKVKRKSLVAQKKQIRKPQSRERLCKSNEDSVCLLDLVQRKTEQFFVRDRSDHDKNRKGPDNSDSSTCVTQIPSEAAAMYSKSISLDCVSNKEQSKDCKSAKALPYMPSQQGSSSMEIGNKKKAWTVNEVYSRPGMKTWQNPEKEMNVINSGDFAQINLSASPSLTHPEQSTSAYQRLDDEDKEGDDDIFLL